MNKIKNYNEFVNESIDLSRINQKNGIDLWISPKYEPLFMEITGLVVPAYPEQGDITYDGKVIGYASNFNGLMIKDYDYIVDNKEKLEEAIVRCKIGMWYTN